MENETYISPIAIDLGAAHTGVYSLIYKAGSTLADVEEKSGVVYELDPQNNTLLMVSRRQKRHQRRNLDRRQMAKRLFRLIWEKHFGLQWDADAAQSIGFLFNRRGFSFITEHYDIQALANFPEEAWQELPRAFTDLIPVDLRNSSGLAEFIMALPRDEPLSNSCLCELYKETNKIKKELVFTQKSIALAKACEAIGQGRGVPVERRKKESPLASVSKWIVERWRDEGVCGLEAVEPTGPVYNIAGFLTEHPSLAETVTATLPDYRAAQNESKQSMWNFAIDKFKLEEAEFERTGETTSEKQDFIRTHLHHLAFAIYTISDELRSGARHRARYFEEVEKVLTGITHRHGYLQRFCGSLQQEHFAGLTPAKLTRLISHISNLELKPLRKYFNDKKHQGGFYWDEERLKRCFSDWVLGQWRVDLAKNRDKGAGKPQDYQKLRTVLQNYEGGIIEFWIGHDPQLSIPPYQDNNNRNPPRCQSLLLNACFLDHAYPSWRRWLEALKDNAADHLGDLETRLLGLESGKKNSYFNQAKSGDQRKDSQKLGMADLDARLFQFILDRRKDSDPLRLADIYGHAKRLRQLGWRTELTEPEKMEQARHQQKLAQTVLESGLPPDLKTSPQFNQQDIFPAGSFLHLVCRYFKNRLRAREGRLFIHPDYQRTAHRGYQFRNRFISENNLLRYCNLKPRQKRYQMVNDVAGVLQVSPDRLVLVARQNHNDGSQSEAVFAWLKDFRGLQTACKNAADSQKEHRGLLKTKLLAGDRALQRLQDRCTQLSRLIAREICSGDEDPEARAQKFSSIFSFAQLYAIAFSDRAGNASTCPVCSLDNSRRMEMVGEDQRAKAQRLPAISTRVIDGAVKRMARILGRKIANDRWPLLKQKLVQGTPVRVPIITESNRFEFEPALSRLKPGVKEKSIGKDTSYEDKRNRIAEQGGGICPYTGQPVGENGEIDHIIPRSSSFGTLNDEANLIFATEQGNKAKGGQFYSLKNLSRTYKQGLFGTNTDEQIAAWIRETLWDERRGRFRFGNYLSFINLGSDEQKAFRHALFLEDGDHVREQVVAAISNRSRAFVNGTQRYFAEVLANEFYKEALDIGKERLISFDYFGVEATSTSRGDGVRDWRRHYEEFYPGEFAPYRKKDGISQHPYSHLLDAQIAFAINADKHRGDGGLRLRIPDHMGLDALNMDTGEILHDNIFHAIRVLPEQMTAVHVQRRRPSDNRCTHRAFTRDLFYADRYLPILLKQEENGVILKAGFTWKNAEVFNKNQRRLLPQLLPLLTQAPHYPARLSQELDKGSTAGTAFEQRLYQLLINTDYFKEQIDRTGAIYLTINRKTLHELWLERHNTKNGTPFENKDHATLFEFCWGKLGYRTEKKHIATEDDLKKLEAKEGNFYTTFNRTKIMLPFKHDWVKLRRRWNVAKSEGQDFDDFLRDFFLKKTKEPAPHHRVRKQFSLPVKSTQSKFMLSRTGWDNTQTFQIINESLAQGQINNKAEAMLRPHKGDAKQKKTLTPWARSASFVKLTKEDYFQGQPVDPNQWYLVTDTGLYPRDEHGELVVDRVWLRVDDVTSPSVAIRLARDADDITRPEIILDDRLCGRKFEKKTEKKPTGGKPGEPAMTADQVMREYWETDIKHQRAGAIITYKASKQYNRERLQALTAECSIAVDRLE
jgi:CRISPR system subtype II-B RNA-guided endonuclease Cas9/Csx12